MKSVDIITKLSKHLFWDVEQKSITPIKHQRFIITRIMDRGTLQDVSIIWDYYGEDAIKQALMTAPAIERKTLFFFANQFNVPPEEFRAYRNKKELTTWGL